MSLDITLDVTVHSVHCTRVVTLSTVTLLFVALSVVILSTVTLSAIIFSNLCCHTLHCVLPISTGNSPSLLSTLHHPIGERIDA